MTSPFFAKHGCGSLPGQIADLRRHVDHQETGPSNEATSAPKPEDNEQVMVHDKSHHELLHDNHVLQVKVWIYGSVMFEDSLRSAQKCSQCSPQMPESIASLITSPSVGQIA